MSVDLHSQEFLMNTQKRITERQDQYSYLTLNYLLMISESSLSCICKPCILPIIRLFYQVGCDLWEEVRSEDFYFNRMAYVYSLNVAADFGEMIGESGATYRLVLGSFISIIGHIKMISEK